MSDSDLTPVLTGEQSRASDIVTSLIETGQHEIDRETDGVLLSGLSAGLDMGFGPLLMAVVLSFSAEGFGDLGTEILVASAYAVGFIFVILGRSELFTEHTTVAVLPVLDGRASVRGLARLWGLVWISNIVGGAAFALLIVVMMPEGWIASPEAFETIGEKLVHYSVGWQVFAAILAGWLMGVLAWLVGAAQSTLSRLVIIWLVTALIGMLHLPHSIAGNIEVLFGVLLSSGVTALDYVVFLVTSTVGNTIGGGVFVATLKYGHVVRGGE